MSRKLVILACEDEYRRIAQLARSQNLPLREWARRALAVNRKVNRDKTVEEKLAAIREAAKYEFPGGDIKEMLAEIESGYLE